MLHVEFILFCWFSPIFFFFTALFIFFFLVNFHFYRILVFRQLVCVLFHLFYFILCKSVLIRLLCSQRFFLHVLSVCEFFSFFLLTECIACNSSFIWTKKKKRFEQILLVRINQNVFINCQSNDVKNTYCNRTNHEISRLSRVVDSNFSKKYLGIFS